MVGDAGRAACAGLRGVCGSDSACIEGRECCFNSWHEFRHVVVVAVVAQVAQLSAREVVQVRWASPVKLQYLCLGFQGKKKSTPVMCVRVQTIGKSVGLRSM